MKTVGYILLILVGLVLLLPGICSLGCTLIWLTSGGRDSFNSLLSIFPIWAGGLLLGAFGIFLLRTAIRSR
jgi:hypothetical protein